MNPIFLRRRLKVVLPATAGVTPVETVVSLQKNLEPLGFALSADLLVALRGLAPTQVEAFARPLVRTLRELVGADRPYRPLYPNFPAEVMARSEAELVWNALVHYATLARPDWPADPRPPLPDAPPLRVVGLGTTAEFEAVFTTLASAKTAYSEEDRADVRWFVSQYRADIARLLPEVIPNRENLAVIAAAVLGVVPAAAGLLDRHVRTATDVLRIAVALSGGDVSLAAATPKFGAFTRAERRLLLGWVERADNRAEDLRRWKPRWVRLGERLHPGEFAGRFPLTAGAFAGLRNNRPVPTFNAAVEGWLGRRDAALAAEVLAARPGEFARRLDHLLRLTVDPAPVLAAFAGVADRVAAPVLLQALAHFRRRPDPAPLRAFFPKGGTGRLFATDRPVPPLAEPTARAAAALCERALRRQFAGRPPLGRCFVDPRLADYPVPFARRSAAKALRTLARGSRVPLPAAPTLRLFVWWANGTSRTDIDLSAAVFDAEYRHLETVAFYNLKAPWAVHSGDVVDAPRGAAEFIDVDVGRCRAAGGRFVVMCLSSYSQQPFCDLPECAAGWMARQAPGSGAVFEPRTVADRVDVAAATRCSLPAVFDLHAGKVVWADLALTTQPAFQNTVRNHLGGVATMLRAVTTLRKPDLHTLFTLHAESRGERVETPEGADTVFAPDRGLTPFDHDRIAAEFL